MATGAIVGGVVGGSMVAGGTAAAIRAQRMKTNPRGVQYGGSPEALDAYRDQYQQGIGTGAGLIGQGTGAQAGLSTDAYGTVNQGRGLIASGMATPTNADPRALQFIQQGGVDANAAADAGAHSALDDIYRQNQAAAVTGGALGQRQAIYENAAAGGAIAQQLAAQRAQNALATDQAAAGQVVTDQGIVQANRGLNLNQAQVGAGLIGTGYGTQLGANNAQIQAGLGTQGQYLGALGDVEQQQNENALDYERRRQANAIRRSQNLWNLGAGLITGGAGVIKSAAGSYGGGGGGGGGGGTE